MRKRGFTLVELLVVIGIIAVLISILLPSLAKARQHANNVMCASNLRSVGQGLLFYANEHKGKLPFSGAAQWGDIWPGQVTMALGGDLKSTGDQWGNVTGTYAAVLRCPDAPIEGAQDAWNGGFHYTANVRAMPTFGDGGMGDPLKPGKPAPYPLATKDSASKMLLWDGPIQMDFGWNAPANNQPQCWWFISWGGPIPNSWVNWWSDPFPGFNLDQVVPPAIDNSYNSLNPTNAKYVGIVNRDYGAGENQWNGNTVGFQRYRHLGNTSGNFLYFDGHVESKKVGTVTYRDISIYPY